MTWLKLDDALWRHPKVAGLAGDKAIPCIGLWCLCLTWVGANLTNGFIPYRGVVQVAGTDAAPHADELVRVGLWGRVDGGFRFHDYLDYNPTRDMVIADRATRQAAARIAGRVPLPARLGPVVVGLPALTLSTTLERYQRRHQPPSSVSRFPSPASPSDPGCSSCGGPTTRQYLDGRWLWLCLICPMEGVA
jgi:hypothetical protein